MNFARHLATLDIRYAITGSMASAVHGEPRSTMNVDLIADLDAASAE